MKNRTLSRIDIEGKTRAVRADSNLRSKKNTLLVIRLLQKQTTYFNKYNSVTLPSGRWKGVRRSKVFEIFITTSKTFENLNNIFLLVLSNILLWVKFITF